MVQFICHAMSLHSILVVYYIFSLALQDGHSISVLVGGGVRNECFKDIAMYQGFQFDAPWPLRTQKCVSLRSRKLSPFFKFYFLPSHLKVPRSHPRWYFVMMKQITYFVANKQQKFASRKVEHPLTILAKECLFCSF